MGIFNIFKMFKGGRALNKLSFAVEEVLSCFDSCDFLSWNFIKNLEFLARGVYTVSLFYVIILYDNMDGECERMKL